MERKKFDLYPEEERETLLIHWWQNYGRVNVNLTEVEEFLELVKQDSGLVFDIALVSSLLGKTTEPLVYAMRTNTLPDFIESVNKAVASDKYQNMRKQLENDLLNRLVHSYNSRATVCLSNDRDLLLEILTAKKHIPLTVEEVFKVYEKCSLKGREKIYGKPTVTVSCGHKYSTMFHASRLMAEREIVADLIDQVAGIDEGTFTPEMKFDKEGKCWDPDMCAVDWLVELGSALGILDIRARLDKNGYASFYVIRNKEEKNRKSTVKVFSKKSDKCKKNV